MPPSLQTLDNLDTDGLVQLQVEQLEKEKKETSERLRIIAKRVDHIERAFRKEEIPLVLADYERQKADDLAAHESLQKRTREESKQKHEADLALKNRLARMLGDYNKVKDDITRTQAGEFERRRKEADVRIAEEKAKLRERVLAERAEERRRQQEEEEAYEREEAERAEAEGQFLPCCFPFLSSAASLTLLLLAVSSPPDRGGRARGRGGQGPGRDRGSPEGVGGEGQGCRTRAARGRAGGRPREDSSPGAAGRGGPRPTQGTRRRCCPRRNRELVEAVGAAAFGLACVRR